MVLIKLNLSLIKPGNLDEIILELAEPKILGEVLESTGVDIDQIGMVIINRRWAPIETYINDNDYVEVFPHLEGG